MLRRRQECDGQVRNSRGGDSHGEGRGRADVSCAQQWEATSMSRFTGGSGSGNLESGYD